MSHLNPQHDYIVVSGDGSTYHGITDTQKPAVVIGYDPSTLSEEAKSDEEGAGDITSLVAEVENKEATGVIYSIPAMLELVEYLNKDYRNKFNDLTLTQLLTEVYK